MSEAGHGSHRKIEHKVYDTKESVIEYLRPFFRPYVERGTPHLEVYRTPGTFVHEYLIGSLTLVQIIDTIKRNPNTCFCCMDERVMMKGCVTSHRGCGAAAIVADMVRLDAGIRQKYAAVVGEKTTQRLLDALKTAEGEALAQAKDNFGAEWSKALAHLAGVADRYEHLDVDDHHHYASGAVLDQSANLMVNTKRKVGEDLFFISNPKKVFKEVMGEKVAREIAYQTLIDYGFLALQIARGDHSSLPPDKIFTIAVARNERVEENLWNRFLHKTEVQTKKVWREKQAKKPIGERVDLHYQIVYINDTDLTSQAR